MKNNIDGNLAVKIAMDRINAQVSSLAVPDAWEESPEYREEKRRLALLRKRKEERERLLLARKNSGIARMKRILVSVALIASLSFIFGGLLLRQSKIYTMNFANTRLLNQIAEQEDLNKQNSKLLYDISDAAEIEKQALHLFGLRRPSQAQRVEMLLPETDKTIFYEQNRFSGMGNEGNLSVLEEYVENLQKTELLASN